MGKEHSEVIFSPIKIDVYESFKELTGADIDRTRCYSKYYTNKIGHITHLAIYCDRTDYSISIHIGSKGPFTRKMIKEVLSFPFRELKIIKLFAKIRSSNKSVLSIADRLGFKLCAVIEDYHDKGRDGDEIIMVATENDIARWIK